MPRVKVSLENPLGMHARLAYSLADLCSGFDCGVRLGYAGEWADGKELVDILGLGVEPGETLTLETNGPGAEAALSRLIRFFETDARIL